MEPRARKLAPHYHNRQDWRSKGPGNFATHRYTREYILKHYRNLLEPEMKCKDQIAEVLLHQPSPPLLTAIFPFAHSLGDEPNSRKYPVREKRSEQMPEWYEEEGNKESAPKSKGTIENTEKTQLKDEAHAEVKLVFNSNVKNFETKASEEKDLEEKFTKIDLQVEEKLKNVQNDDDIEVPEWDEPSKEEFQFEPIKTAVKPAAPVFDLYLLRYHFAIGNPFAQTLIEFGIPLGKTNITFAPSTKPFEKIWYYKDLEGQMHGPFSTLEMFTWTIRDCFPPDLQIAIGDSMYFVPMNIFNSVPQIPDPVFYPPSQNTEKKPKDSKSQQEIESQQHVQPSKFKNRKNSDNYIYALLKK